MSASRAVTFCQRIETVMRSKGGADNLGSMTMFNRAQPAIFLMASVSGMFSISISGITSLPRGGAAETGLKKAVIATAMKMIDPRFTS